MPPECIGRVGAPENTTTAKYQANCRLADHAIDTLMLFAPWWYQQCRQQFWRPHQLTKTMTEQKPVKLAADRE